MKYVLSLVSLIFIFGFTSITDGAGDQKLLLYWESDSYISPYFSEVKPLITPGTSVRVIAWPEFSVGDELVPHSRINFEWRYNGRKLPDRSGFGINVLELPDISRPDRISVTATYSDGRLSESATMKLPIEEPLIQSYQVTPLGGPQLGLALPSELTVNNQAIVEMITIPFYVNADKISDLRTISDQRPSSAATRLILSERPGIIERLIVLIPNILGPDIEKDYLIYYR